MADLTFEKIAEDRVMITRFPPLKEERSKEELEGMKIKTEAKLKEINDALGVFK